MHPCLVSRSVGGNAELTVFQKRHGGPENLVYLVTHPLVE